MHVGSTNWMTQVYMYNKYIYPVEAIETFINGLPENAQYLFLQAAEQLEKIQNVVSTLLQSNY